MDNKNPAKPSSYGYLLHHVLVCALCIYFKVAVSSDMRAFACTDNSSQPNNTLGSIYEYVLSNDSKII